MQFTSILLTLVAALTLVCATPVASPDSPDIDSFPPIPDSCGKLACLKSLGPSIVDCAEALLDKGLNLVKDDECFKAAEKAYHTVPAACKGCF